MPPTSRRIVLPRTRPDGSKRNRPTPTPAQQQANAAAFIADMDRRGIRPIKVGRPRQYSPACCDIALEVGNRGGSWASIATALGLSRDGFDRWKRDFPDFQEACSRAQVAAQAYLEAHGIKNLRAKHYQANVWAKSMSARFAEYREVKQASVGEIAVDLLAAIEQVAAKLAPGGTLQLPGDGAKPVVVDVLKDDGASRHKP